MKILNTNKDKVNLGGIVNGTYSWSRFTKKCCEEIHSFVKLAQNLEVDQISIIATASLRNINNLEEVQTALENAVGRRAEVLTGQEEARLDFVGASHYLNVQSGVIIDIGGGSTELVQFKDGKIQHLVSLPIGSLNLYTQYSSSLFPTEKDRKQMRQRVKKEFSSIDWLPLPGPITLCGIGGTARGFFKLCRELYNVPKCQTEVDAGYVREINKKLKTQDFRQLQSIYRVVPDRVFTILPGMTILNQAVKKFGPEHFVVSKPGIREGYLFDRILRS